MRKALLTPSPLQKRISLGFGIFSAAVLLAALILALIEVDGTAYLFPEKIESFVTSLALAMLATLLTYRRPENVIGWLLAAAAILRMASFLEIILSAIRPEGSPITAAYVIGTNLFFWWSGLTYTLIAFIFTIFPDGKLPSPRWRPAFALLGLQFILTLGLGLYLAADILRHFAAAEAAGRTIRLVPTAEIGPLSFALHVRQVPGLNVVVSLIALIAFLLVVLGLAAQLQRFRSGNYVQRQQIKWVIFAMVIWAAMIPLLFLPVGIPPTVLTLGFIPVPVSVTLAIFRYRLYEIDIIINRTLVYGSLSTALLLVYFASVVVFEALTRGLTGARSPLATVLATLLIAAIFQPLRRRLQDLIDRAFFQRKYDAQQTLESFAGFVRDEVSLDRLTEALIRSVSETLQPSQLQLMIDMPGGAFEPAEGREGRT